MIFLKTIIACISYLLILFGLASVYAGEVMKQRNIEHLIVSDDMELTPQRLQFQGWVAIGLGAVLFAISVIL